MPGHMTSVPSGAGQEARRSSRHQISVTSSPSDKAAYDAQVCEGNTSSGMSWNNSGRRSPTSATRRRCEAGVRQFFRQERERNFLSSAFLPDVIEDEEPK